MSTLSETLRRNLDTQYELAKQLDTLLQRERDAILARQWSELIPISQDKQVCVSKLQGLHAELARQAGSQPMGRWLQAHGLADEHTALMQVAANLAQRNREAYGLLERQQQRVGTALRLLGSSGAPALYGRRGLSPASAPRRSWAAA